MKRPLSELTGGAPVPKPMITTHEGYKEQEVKRQAEERSRVKQASRQVRSELKEEISETLPK